jgi:hypothetical protein
MSLQPLWDTVLDWRLSAALRGEFPGTEWLFPIVETIHVMALTLVFGSIAMVDLRLMGLASKGTPISKLSKDILPWTWTAWCVAAVMGGLMFIAKADTYAGNLQFRLKFACMGLAAINMLAFQFTSYKHVARWDLGVPPARVKLAGAISILCWTGVIFFGRWVGFTT